jgi:transcriptional regulator with XRE-family HTH domain
MKPMDETKDADWPRSAMDLRVVFASNVRRLRSERGLSQCRLAAEAELNRSYLSRLENARNSATLELIAKLADVLGVQPAELLTSTEPDQSL